MQKIIIITGPTASGKSKIGHSLAKENGCVIINCDSMQLYKELPILTAQPTTAEKREVEYRLYGGISVVEDCSAGKWLEMAKKEIDQVRSAGKTPVLVGGTGMYIKGLTEGIADIPDIDPEVRKQARAMYDDLGAENFHLMLFKCDPDTALRLKKNDRQRLIRAWEVFKQTGKTLTDWHKAPGKKYYDAQEFGVYYLNPDRAKLYERINDRFKEMLNEGALDEAKRIHELHLSLSKTAIKAHGLRELIAYHNGMMTMEEVTESASQQVRNYAKRQFTWRRNQLKTATEIKDFKEIVL